MLNKTLIQLPMPLWFSRSIMVLLIAVITFLSLAPIEGPAGGNDKLNHLLAYIALAFWLDRAWPKPGIPAIRFIVLAAYGLLIEFLQGQTTYRFFDWWDWLADLVGIWIYWLGALIQQKLQWRWIKLNP